MKTTFIGDVHGKFSAYLAITDECKASIQVGDFGVGFGIEPPIPGPRHHFIRGNHDNPEEANAMISCLGDYGMYSEKLFYAAGAYSIDRAYRVEGRYWWPGEELSDRVMKKATSLYTKKRPEMVVTHMLPHSIQQRIFDCDPEYRNRTGDFLDRLAAIHLPRVWVCGHYHKAVDAEIFGCRFIVLPELGTIELDV